MAPPEGVSSIWHSFLVVVRLRLIDLKRKVYFGSEIQMVCVCVCIQEHSQPGLGILSDFTLKKKKGGLLPFWGKLDPVLHHLDSSPPDRGRPVV